MKIISAYGKMYNNDKHVNLFLDIGDKKPTKCMVENTNKIHPGL